MLAWTTTRERHMGSLDDFMHVVEVTAYRIEEEDWDVPPGLEEVLWSETVWYQDLWPLWAFGGE